MTETKKQNWFRKHWIISIFLGLIVLGMIFPGTENNSTMTGNVVNEQDNQQIKQIIDTTKNNVVENNYPKETEKSKAEVKQKTEPIKENILEMELSEILDMFNGLSDLQRNEKINELKGKRIKTTIFAYKISQASWSTQYVVMDDDNYPSIKAFFPNEEKEKLLNIDIGGEIILSGEFVTYKEGYYKSYVEFTKSKLIEIK